MKPLTEQLSKKTAFTIVELLTVMSIIVIVMALLFPSLSAVQRYAKEVKQQTQFHSISAGLELFRNDWDDYPPSNAETVQSQRYCGAMKLCEAMVGQDLMGFHHNSRFKRDCTDGADNDIYGNPVNGFDPPVDDPNNLKVRKTYLQLEKANAYRMWHLYGAGLGDFGAENGPYLFVLCDEYSSVTNQDTGKKIGMPVLYYRADTSGFEHDPNTSSLPVVGDNGDYIYNYTDNDALVALGPPPHTPGPQQHPLYDTTTNFYEITRDKKIDNVVRPVRPDSYILISAGFDGIYGTKDDITNF